MLPGRLTQHLKPGINFYKTPAMNLRLLLLLLLLSASSALHCQNLVPNPSFEEFEGNCPDSIVFDNLKNWYSAYITPDYYTICNQLWFYKAPTTTAGYQLPLDGKGYIGFVYYAGNGTEDKEFIQVKLSNKLKAGRLYQLSFYVNLANKSRYAIGQLGAWLHADSMTNSLDFFTSIVNPQVTSALGKIFYDTLTWQNVVGCFEANGDEQYLTLGSFRKNSATEYLLLDDISGDFECCAYYFIDMVELNEISVCSTFDVINNLISPNSDGVNDIVQFTDENAENCSLQVYNRWGNLVYSTSGKSLVWNGLNQQGNALVAGVYYYVLDCGNERKNGTITLFN
jgi:gliding motility-associated-like protein